MGAVTTIIFLLLILAVVAYFNFFYKKKTETFIIDYSEIQGDTEIEHKKSYIGRVTPDGNSYVISALDKLRRPYPPSWAFIPTNSETKKLRLIKVDQGRFAYRTPTKHKEVFVYKFDDDGKVVKFNNMVQLVKHNHRMCDDYVEQEVKNWERVDNQEKELKHKMQSKFDAYKPLLYLAIIGGVIIVMFYIGVKGTQEGFQALGQTFSGQFEKQNSQAEKILDSLDKFQRGSEGIKEVPNEIPGG